LRLRVSGKAIGVASGVARFLVHDAPDVFVDSRSDPQVGSDSLWDIVVKPNGDLEVTGGDGPTTVNGQQGEKAWIHLRASAVNAASGERVDVHVTLTLNGEIVDAWWFDAQGVKTSAPEIVIAEEALAIRLRP